MERQNCFFPVIWHLRFPLLPATSSGFAANERSPNDSASCRPPPPLPFLRLRGLLFLLSCRACLAPYGRSFTIFRKPDAINPALYRDHFAGGLI
ncbi:hypothetical protein CDAR_163721 [Caerostris darwini]|uniref:Secreted protein n=1 Tax=Caerostris darwini TaxID=1538125 RepID=A0AAV4RVG9_9ARAC|nr:hypothetical protein CDAR_163721 [Caerostris darwini]